jgi:hypothetical protein
MTLPRTRKCVGQKVDNAGLGEDITKVTTTVIISDEVTRLSVII